MRCLDIRAKSLLCIGGVGDQLMEENFLVGVEGVDDHAHQMSMSAHEGFGS